MTYKELYKYGVNELRSAGIEDFSFDAKQLLFTACNITSTDFLLSENNEVEAKKSELYYSFLQRRSQGEPLQYIIGMWEFLDSSFKVGKGVLIPRPETEQLTMIGINFVKKNKISVVFDLCAGTGCIGISIAKACPETKVYLLEKYFEAIEFCKKNVELNGVKNVCVIRGDIFEGLPEGVEKPQMIISNPPYIPRVELAVLQREVQYEPVTALDGGEDGLLFYHCIAEKWLKEKAIFCAVECGENESDAIARIFSEFGNVNVENDVFGTDRFVCVEIKE